MCFDIFGCDIKKNHKGITSTGTTPINDCEFLITQFEDILLVLLLNEVNYLAEELCLVAALVRIFFILSLPDPGIDLKFVIGDRKLTLFSGWVSAGLWR